MRLKTAVLAAACLAICAAPASALAKAKPATTYYLSVGDSLAAGAQPNAAGNTLATNQGYADFLYKTEQAKRPGLELKKLGCLGESTSSMIKGGPFCPYAGTQLGDAVKFIKTHKVALITIDIGANDVDFCATGLNINLTCLTNGEASIRTNAPKILDALRKAAGPKVKIAGMTYYDPFLADYLIGTGGQVIAKLSVDLANQVNGTLVSAFKAKNVKVADVATAFKTDAPFTTTGTLHGKTEPLAVVGICTYTWECTAPPRGPNIHATTLGYKTIAGVFAAKL
jgi:hypothetical protein